MGDNPIVEQAAVQAVDKLTEISEKFDSQNDKSAGDLEGFHILTTPLNDIADATASINENVGESGWFNKTLSQILDFNNAQLANNAEAVDFRDSILDSISNLISLDETSFLDNDKEKKKKAKPNAKVNDLKDLPWAIGTLGAVLANTLTESNKDDKKKGGISGFFKGLLEGVGGIASLGVALLTFAGATLLFNFVDWGSALKGLVAFSVFTVGMVGLSKLIGPEQKNLKEFATASLIMSAALGVFGISLYITSALFNSEGVNIKAGDKTIMLPSFSVLNAIKGLVAFTTFTLGMVGLSKLIGSSNGDFVKFALGSIAMCGALVAFSLAMVIVSNIFDNGVNLGPIAKLIDGRSDNTILKIGNPAKLAAGIGAFLAFEVGIALISNLVGSSMGSLTKFAIGSMMMCGALVTFALAMTIVDGIFTNGVNVKLGTFEGKLEPVGMGSVFAAIGAFTTFLLSTVVLAGIASSFMKDFVLFGVASTLMSLSLVAFAVAITVAGTATVGGDIVLGDKKYSIPKNNGAKALLAIPIMAGFLVAFAGIGALLMNPLLLAAISIGTVTIAAVSGVILSMSKAMALSSLVATGGSMEWNGKKYDMIPIDKASMTASFDTFEILLDNVIATSKKMGGVSLLKIKKLDDMVDIIGKIAEVISKSMRIKTDVEASGAVWSFEPMAEAMNYVVDITDKLVSTANRMDKNARKALPVIAASMIPIVEAMDKIVDVIKKALLMRSDLESKGVKFVGNGIDPQILNGICDPIMQVLLGPSLDGTGGLMGAAEGMNKKGAQVLQLVSQSMLPVAQTIEILVNTIEKAATLGGSAENTKSIIDEGVKNIQYLMVGEVTKSKGFWGQEKISAEGGFVGIFNIISKSINSIKGGTADAMSAMKDAADSLVGVLDSIKVISEHKEDVERAQEAFTAITSAFGTTKTEGTIFYFFKKYKDNKPNWGDLKKSFDEMQEAVTSMAKVFENSSWIDSIVKCADIPDLSIFSDRMEYFNKGMKSFAASYAMVKHIPENWITKFGESFATIDAAKLDNLDRMAAFAEKAAALSKTADGLERIADAFKRINKENSKNPLSEAADNLGSFVADAWGNLTGKSTAERKGETTGEASVKPVKKGQELETIARILNEWDSRGVKVVGFDTQDKSKAIRTLTI